MIASLFPHPYEVGKLIDVRGDVPEMRSLPSLPGMGQRAQDINTDCIAGSYCCTYRDTGVWCI